MGRRSDQPLPRTSRAPVDYKTSLVRQGFAARDARGMPRGEGGRGGETRDPPCLPDTGGTLHTPRLTLGRGVPVVFRDHRETGGSMSTGEGRGGKTKQLSLFWHI